MKSKGNLAAALKERIEFSLIDFILLSEDCNMFIPLPLCPITTNFGNLNVQSWSPSWLFTPGKQKKPKRKKSFTKKNPPSQKEPYKNPRTVKTWKKKKDVITFIGETRGTEGKFCIIWETRHIRDMNSFESHLSIKDFQEWRLNGKMELCIDRGCRLRHKWRMVFKGQSFIFIKKMIKESIFLMQRWKSLDGHLQEVNFWVGS